MTKDKGTLLFGAVFFYILFALLIICFGGGCKGVGLT